MPPSRFETPRSRRPRMPAREEPYPAAAWEPFLRSIGKLDRAVNDLRRRAPDFSAATPTPSWQRVILLAMSAAFTAGLILLDGPGLFLWTLALALPFLMIAAVRAVAVWRVFRQGPEDVEAFGCDRRFDARLPSFSVLIPLYRERAVAEGLVKAMARLDYPEDRLEFLFITEADDHATRQALVAARLGANMRIVTVPSGLPRTKPRALNYALQDARGVLVAVYDAEDIPDADQLRLAAEAFIEGGPRLACVQARLGIYTRINHF